VRLDQQIREGQFDSFAVARVGLRHFGVKGKNLFWDSKRFVVRGVVEESIANEALATWRDLGAAIVSKHRRGSLLTDASEFGVLCIVLLEKEQANEVVLRSIAQHASAAIAVLPANAALSENVQVFCPNLVLAQRVEETSRLAPWAQIAWVGAKDTAWFAQQAAGLSLPIIAVRHYHGDSLAEARAAIDQLQADLAPIGQFAGYVV